MMNRRLALYLLVILSGIAGTALHKLIIHAYSCM